MQENNIEKIDNQNAKEFGMGSVEDLTYTPNKVTEGECENEVKIN